MTDRYYVPHFLGQFGTLFSGGVYLVARNVRSLGITTEVMDYSDVQHAIDQCKAFHKAGYKLGAVGFSLGTSTIDYLQQTVPFELIVCMAMSSLETTWKINHTMVKRSVLWDGPDFLSDAGTNLGFDEVKHTSLPHLLIPYSPTIRADIVARFKAIAVT